MKRVHFLFAMLGVAIIAGLAACGKKDDGGGSSSSSPTYTQYQGSCQSGYVQTQYGCLPQGNCQVGQGFYAQQNTCVVATVNGTNVNNGWNNNGGNCQGSCSYGYVQTAYGCLPQGSCGSCRALYNGNQCVNSSVSTNNGWNNGNTFPGAGNNGCYVNGVQTSSCNWNYYQQIYGAPQYYWYNNAYRYGWNPGYYGNFNLGAYIWINL